uniref:Uncharacterized protein n=1 Tax=Lotharella globosa TaxID=91324 RepID=A0A7S3YL59_9EUKA
MLDGKESTVPVEKAETDTRGLKWWHLAATIFMGLQSIVINISPIDTKFPSAVGFPDRSNAQGALGSINVRRWASTDVQGLITAFLALAAADHLICTIIGFVSPDTFGYWFCTKGANPLRWFEYSVSASIMSVLIASLSGVYDVHLHFMIGITTGLCQLMGWIIETMPRQLLQPPSSHSGINSGSIDEDIVKTIRTVGMMIFGVATITLISGWCVSLCYFSQASPPDFVYAAYIGTIIAYATFAINMFLERFLGVYDFVKAEKIYIVLSFTAKTFLAWDVYGGFRSADN